MFVLRFQEDEQFLLTFGEVTEVHIYDYDWFDGPYEVTPRFEDQTLETQMKLMRDDVTVNEIPVEIVPNVAGGNTVTIGG